ncbi:hypothetical protein [Ruminococcus albus]|uniref:Uncharacterized protein n=1 Tax=Ruminococcus albus (strain ATCC 27210 / DSM 20455 / JCM 14654 / NCDO 2250 / 7) TaxID=697329 RepID=E6UJV8_RUMA7|nr:hypothetical protein [Ruminococcus albus]ADU23954.1 hypothetical protein Rumal_3509 [Ruminococcus albus 7 = DSM 20455]
MTSKQFDEIIKENKELIEKAFPDEYTPVEEIIEQKEKYEVIVKGKDKTDSEA